MSPELNKLLNNVKLEPPKLDKLFTKMPVNNNKVNNNNKENNNNKIMKTKKRKIDLID